MIDNSHVWGPHKAGIRWVQCQRCDCLLHEREAKEHCPNARAGLDDLLMRAFLVALVFALALIALAGMFILFTTP